MSVSGDFAEIFAGADPIPVGLRVGGLIHATRITGADPVTGEIPDGIEAQLRNAFANMQISVENAGGTLANVAQVSLFLSDARAAMASVNTQWVATFPDAQDRPTYKFMASSLPTGHLVNIEYFAVRGARRRVVNIQGVAHTNPIPMAVCAGDYLFSSRVLPMDPATGTYPSEFATQMQMLFGNLASVLAEGGRTWRDVVQGRLFIADIAQLPTVESHWASLFPEPQPRPVLHAIRYSVAPTLLVMLEIIAVRN